MLVRARRGDRRVPGEDAPQIIVNDAMRRPPSTQLIAALAPVAARAASSGVSPLAADGRARRTARARSPSTPSTA